MKTIGKHLNAIMFFSVIFVIFIISLLLPEKGFSEYENRYLSSKPQFSFASYTKGDFSREYEEYIDDQFPFRDSFITVKSMSEMLSGKMENNGIIVGDDGYLFEKQLSYDTERVSKNISYLKKFGNMYGGSHRILFSLIFSSYGVLD